MDNRKENVKRIEIGFEAWAEPRNITVYLYKVNVES